MTASTAAARRLYQWDGVGWLRTPLSVVLACAAVLLGFAVSMSLEGVLRYGPIGIGLVALAVLVASPGNRRTLATYAAPLSFSWVGAIFCASALAAYAVLSTGTTILRRGGPWPDIAPGRLRRANIAAAVTCGIVCTTLAVEALLSA